MFRAARHSFSLSRLQGQRYLSSFHGIDDLLQQKPRLSVIGVGGAGSNTVQNMIDRGMDDVELVVANTDAQALQLSTSPKKVQIGKKLTSGLGAGARPEVGRLAAEENLEEIIKSIEGRDMIFITAGMGGGTGTGAAPVIASAAKQRGILTVGIVTKPFNFEGPKRMKMALQGLEDLQQHVDTLIVIPNQRVLALGDRKLSFKESFALVNDVLYEGVRAVTDVIVKPGLINLDFADVRTIMQGPGWGIMGTETAEGKDRARIAASAALRNPLLEDINRADATGVLISITGGRDLGLLEVDEIVEMINQNVSSEANIIFGATCDEQFDGKVQVSLIVTGLYQQPPQQQQQVSQPPPQQQQQKASPPPAVPRQPVYSGVPTPNTAPSKSPSNPPPTQSKFQQTISSSSFKNPVPAQNDQAPVASSRPSLVSRVPQQKPQQQQQTQQPQQQQQQQPEQVAQEEENSDNKQPNGWFSRWW
eukprot:TRINITY_DN7635_c0_g1_i1.p1 TRINITY_DN7635_c0_g1~~TRINITY_DN7635_c0_g1_i1.p1  ORF type:complete len:487 (-),score=228.07 TRINITY_DN7635_c0_g1_i1:102-1529(-)